MGRVEDGKESDGWRLQLVDDFTEHGSRPTLTVPQPTMNGGLGFL